LQKSRVFRAGGDDGDGGAVVVPWAYPADLGGRGHWWGGGFGHGLNDLLEGGMGGFEGDAAGFVGVVELDGVDAVFAKFLQPVSCFVGIGGPWQGLVDGDGIEAG